MTMQIELTAGFTSWFASLTDPVAKTRILSRFERAQMRNLGDWKPIASAPGLFEMRIDYGPGYRIYFARRKKTTLVILGGGTKADQRTAIASAARLLKKLGEAP